MAGFEKDEVPMLSDTDLQLYDEHAKSKLQSFSSRTRSASLSIPLNSVDSFESRSNLVGYTGPLRSEKRTTIIQMSGPLVASRKVENLSRPTPSVLGLKIVEPSAEKYPSFNGIDQNDWPGDNNLGKNEHLLKSGQLGICNDPYCTTCPTYYNFKETQRKNSKATTIFDPKVFPLFYAYGLLYLSLLIMIVLLSFHVSFKLYASDFQVLCCIYDGSPRSR